MFPRSTLMTGPLSRGIEFRARVTRAVLRRAQCAKGLQRQSLLAKIEVQPERMRIEWSRHRRRKASLITRVPRYCRIALPLSGRKFRQQMVPAESARETNHVETMKGHRIKKHVTTRASAGRGERGDEKRYY